jgi:hypothetical protein
MEKNDVRNIIVRKGRAIRVFGAFIPGWSFESQAQIFINTEKDFIISKKK